MKNIVIIILICICAYGGYEYFRVEGLIAKSKLLVAQTVPYQKPNAFVSILVLGDSTAVGVGASSPDDSIPALLGGLLNASIENHAVSGAVTADMEGQLHEAREKHYDVVLIQVGANDIVGIGSLDAVNAQMQTLLSDVLQYSNKVVLMTAGRV